MRVLSFTPTNVYSRWGTTCDELRVSRDTISTRGYLSSYVTSPIAQTLGYFENRELAEVPE